MATMKVFVSHSSQDKVFCRKLVVALRGAGADVWYDEHNLGTGVLRREIMRELADRPVFLVVLSKAAFASDWVQDECEWAYNLYKRKPERLMLPVTAGPYVPDDFDALLYLESMKRIEGPGRAPYLPAEAIERTLHLLALTPAGRPTAPAPTPQPSESVGELLAQGRALSAQNKHAEALPFFERAAQRDPSSADAWFNLGYVLDDLNHYEGAVEAYDRSLALTPDISATWNNKGVALGGLKRHQEALAAYDQATALDPDDALAWVNKGKTLDALGRHQEALAAYDRALALNPNDADTWSARAGLLQGPDKLELRLSAYQQVTLLEPENVDAWWQMGMCLQELGREQEAVSAFDRVLALTPNDAGTWLMKGLALLECDDAFDAYEDALEAFEHSLRLNPKEADGWYWKGEALRALGRFNEAAKAHSRARELGWED